MQIAKAFGGRPVEFESREASGSRFWCTLELMKEMKPELSIVSPGRPVLVVDDDEDNRAVISHHLQKLGCQVDVAENGDVAIRSLEALSSGSSHAHHRMHRSRPYGVTSPAEAGMDGLITKPLESSILKGVLNQWIKTVA